MQTLSRHLDACHFMVAVAAVSSCTGWAHMTAELQDVWFLFAELL